MLKLRAFTLSALTFAAAGCIGTKTPPAPSEQAEVNFGERIYVADQSHGPGGVCAFVGPSSTSSTGAGMVTTFFGKTGQLAAAYSTASTMFHNCYIRVQPGTLRVDKFTVSNDQYQLCVDSSFCTDPDPSDVDRERVCKVTDDGFWNCPVVSITRDQAARYCEFVGLRLPSGFEHMTFRTAGASSPDAVPEFPRDQGAPGNACADAVLDGCGSQVTPMGLGAGTPVGAAANDVLGGIYDLTGNEREWARDLVPTQPPTAGTDANSAIQLPWFCTGPVSTSTSFDDWPTSCPDDYICLHGRRMLPDGTFRDDLPVCVLPTSLAPPDAAVPPALALENGSLPASFGTGIEHIVMADPADPSRVISRDHFAIGPFVRTVYGGGLEFVNRGLGFRCVGNAGDPATGILQSVPGP